MVKEYGWDDNPIGKKVKFAGDTSGLYLEVIGVVNDFNQKSLYNPIAPLIFLYRPTNNIIQLNLMQKILIQLLHQLKNHGTNIFLNCHLNIHFLTRILIRNMQQIRNAGKYLQLFLYSLLLLPVLAYWVL